MIVLSLLLAFAAGGQRPACGADAARAMAEAAARVDAFDLSAAAALLEQAVEAGCVEARLPALYVRGWRRPAPWPAEISRLVLTAALAAAEGERGTMDLFLRQATDMAALQHAAGQPGAPLLSAFEVTGDLWFDAGATTEARAAYARAAEVAGRTPRVVAGLAQSAMRLGDAPAACREIRALLTWWGDRDAPPPAVAEERAWLRDPGCG